MFGQRLFEIFQAAKTPVETERLYDQIQVEMLEERLVLSSLAGAVANQPSASDTNPATPHIASAPHLTNELSPLSNNESQPRQDRNSSEETVEATNQTPLRSGADSSESGSILPTAWETEDPGDPAESTPFNTPRIQSSGNAAANSITFDTGTDLTFETDPQLIPNSADIDLDSLTRPTDPASLPVISQENSPGSESADWFIDQYETVTIKYDFRDAEGYSNTISVEQQALAVQALQGWSEASGGKIEFIQDTEADLSEIVNIGVGDLAAFGHTSQRDGTLGLSQVQTSEQNEHPKVVGMIWLDQAENWENNYNNGNVNNSYDFFTVIAHEAGHVSGLEDIFQSDPAQLMSRSYENEHNLESISQSLHNAIFMPMDSQNGNGANAFVLHAMVATPEQLTPAEVADLLNYGSEVTASNDAIIAIVDRNGNILGVRAEQEVLDNFAGDPQGLAFAIDGAVAKARTAALFSNGDPNNGDGGTFAPLTSRLVRFISQSTVTEREVNSNPNDIDPNSTVRGPGFIAPIGLGGHFPPDIPNTPQVDLFAIEHTNRDSIIHPGDDGIKGTADDVTLRGRFNIDPAFVPAGQELAAPEAYGFVSGINPGAQSRGIATLPGGIPLFRDTDLDGIGDTLIGGVGVFFPGPDGYASFEQGFVPGVGQTTEERTNAPKVLEAELIALAVAGGSTLAAEFAHEPLAKTAFAGNPVSDIDLPFGRLDLVGIQLAALGPTAGCVGIMETVELALNTPPGVSSGADQIVSDTGDLNNNGVFDAGIDIEDPMNLGNFTADPQLYRNGLNVPEGYLVTPHASATDPALTAAVVQQIIEDAIEAAEVTRAAVRLEAPDQSPGARTRMVFAVTDTNGEVLGLYRMQDATTFSIDVAVAKARNVAYYSDPDDVLPIDKDTPFDPNNTSPEPIDPATAFTNRTFRYLSEPRFPDGVDGTPAAPFSILNNPSIDPTTGENIGAPAAASTFTSVLGYDAFNPQTNFRDPGDAGVMPAVGASTRANQNGVVFFPGSTPLYINNQIVGGFGVSGDGVDQDDVVTYLGATEFLPDGVNIPRADQVFVDGVRLPYQKFLRNPFG
ncbi:heme-binding protein [uncultured Rubinisphaera sp.]|uniref:heme-binding protein n=1 Tax=uncultured Rubinisphaera sp. TaxID=1678686 RepID=UPI0030DC99A8